MKLNYYIGYSTDDRNRYLSSSGGVGAEMIKYLMNSCEYGTSMTFIFNTDDCRYVPKLIYDFKDYNNCGSIYQDTDTIGFIKNNLKKIRNGIIVTCMPCQVSPIKSILSRNNIKHFIISLCCSGQTTVQGTWCYYRLLGLNKEDVSNIQYRGNGWPSGIQIKLKDGKKIRKDNYTYPWNLIHKSLLFRPKRCLYCPMKTTPYADVSLADPWLSEYIEKDRIGNSVIICNDRGNSVIKLMMNNSLLQLQKVSESTYVDSQLGTIKNKAKSAKYKKFNRIVERMGNDASLYKRVFTASASLLKIHVKMLRIIKRLSR